jgi:hypothetical protein
MIYDATGKRKEAVKRYEDVLDMDEYLNSYGLAEKYIEKPFSR